MRDFRSNQDVARQRINALLVEARGNPLISRRYVVLARKMATKHRVRFTRGQKMMFCKRCNAFFNSGNCTKRLSKGKIILTCKECGFVRRFTYTGTK